MTVTPFADLPVLPDRAHPWDAGQAESRVRAWASNGDTVDWRRYARAFLWFDGAAPDPDNDNLPDQFGAYKLPIADVVNGTLTAIPRGIFAAAGAVSGAQGGVNVPGADQAGLRAQLDKYYAKTAKAVGDSTIETPWEAENAHDSSTEAPDGRASSLTVRPFVGRSYALTDCTIRADGTGRIVEAYCAAFNSPTEIHDQDGHYMEMMAPTSFNKTVADNGTRFGVFYNHAMTIHGQSDGSLSVPIGVPVEPPRADAHGLLTVTQYLDNPLADSVLDAIKKRAITGQSFSGRFMRSTKTRGKGRGDLPTITRDEVAMREYGPTVFPAYQQAHIVGTRSADSFMRDLLAMDPAERADMFRAMATLATLPSAAPDEAPQATTQVAGPAEYEPHTHSARQSDIARRIRAGLAARSGN